MEGGFFNRKTIRLKAYDYSQAGYYFITICTQNRRNLFGNIKNGEIILNSSGSVAYYNLLDIPNHIRDVNLDIFCIMPNHVHLIIVIENVGSPYMATEGKNSEIEKRSPCMVTPQTKSIYILPKTIQQYKASVTKNTAIPDIWQSKFYDHIIRNDYELKKIREYIINNPAKWQLDKYYVI